MIKGLDEAVILTPRDKIYSIIVQNPGLHFREIQRRTNIATGALQYHLEYLKKKSLIREEKEGKFSRFYSINSDVVDSKLMNLLRQDSVRKIVIFLMNRKRVTLQSISKGVDLGVSTTSFHLQKLVNGGVVVQKHQGGKVFFSLKNKKSVLLMLLEYRESFLDSLVDNFIDTWEKEFSL
ncbi:MAG: winged helix-turn-helix transcriptional regulator [Candidatus Iainarchaeum sp.]|jgi:predicted transcriptional regulator|nr:MAG: Helix-turn-helix domain protein [archaeon ADurb.Bin336]